MSPPTDVDRAAAEKAEADKKAAEDAATANAAATANWPIGGKPRAKHVGNYISPSLNIGITTSPDQKKKKTRTHDSHPHPTANSPSRPLPSRPPATAAPSPVPSPRAPPAPRPAPHPAFPPASPPRHRRPPRRPGPRASSSSAAGRAPPLRWPARHRPRPPPLRRTARHRPLPSSPADVPSSPPAAPLLCTFTACRGNGNRGRVQGNKEGENKEYTRRGREVTASKPMTRALLHAMNATRDIKKRVPWVVGVEVDPNGGPSVQEADMRLYHSRNRGAGEEAGKIELLQAFQAVEAVVQRFFFMYQQVVAAVCATEEERVQ